MDALCKHCKVKHFPKKPKISSCCHKGKIDLPPMTPPPDYVKNVYLKNTVDSQNFKENIRLYNKALAFASMENAKKWQLLY